MTQQGRAWHVVVVVVVIAVVVVEIVVVAVRVAGIFVFVAVVKAITHADYFAGGIWRCV